MPISPPSDIILGVANAADPLKSRAAAEELARVAGAKVPEAEAAPGVKFELPQAAQAVQPRAKLQLTADTPAAQSAAKLKAYKEFEAFLLQSFIESILPKDSAGYFGGGTAGEIWKSMFAEHVGRELAESNAFGIAEQIADHKARIDKARASHPALGGAAAQTALAAALADPEEARRNAAAKSSSALPGLATTGLFGRHGS